MVYKNWKKIKDRKNLKVWYHKNKNLGVSFEKSMGGLGEKYVVYYGNMNNASSKGFKNKEKALDYAKSYMRNN